MEVDTLTEDQVCRIFRSANVSLVGGHMAELRQGLTPLQEHGCLLEAIDAVGLVAFERSIGRAAAKEGLPSTTS